MRYDDKHTDKERVKVEWYFSLLKQYRRVATRYEKTKRNFLSFVHLASMMIFMRKPRLRNLPQPCSHGLTIDAVECCGHQIVGSAEFL